MKLLRIFAVAACSCAAVLPVAGQNAKASGEAIRVGPAAGTLMVVGGGQLGSEIINRFVYLAGGAERARIVVIPTAGEQDTFPADWVGYRQFRDAGVKHIRVLHTRDRNVAGRDDFIAPLREANAVWILGGRQWRLADSYLDTRTLEELRKLLDRGGVIGGTSAGASIQASYMVRGAREGNTLIMAPGYEQGFGFLRDAAVDQHLLARSRQNDMLEVIEKHPNLLGIGIDESTAIVVRGDTAEVLGKSKVAFYNTDRANPKSYFFLQQGDRLDLNRRTVLIGKPEPAK